MAVTKEMQAMLARIDAATSAVAKKIDDLNAKISTDMSQEDVTTVTTQLGAVADHLEAIASNPANPVPQPPPEAELPPVPPAPPV